MGKDVFEPTGIMLPEETLLDKWSVIACDQFSSQREYWERVRAMVRKAPSTLNMIIPEAFLGEADEETEISGIRQASGEYLESGLLRVIDDSFVYVERTLPDGCVRRGLVGTVNLDEYDFTGQAAAVRASEGTVLDRLPVRIRIRRAVDLESPHIILFIEDKEKTVIEPLSDKADKLPLLYSFELMEGGGHIKGMRVAGDDIASVVDGMRALHDKNGILMVVGDGNHSLAAAKMYWDEIKKSLSDAERDMHPARKALVELNNVYDPSISFKAIHRVVLDIEPAEVLRFLEDAVPKGTDYQLRWVYNGKSGSIGCKAECIGDMLEAVQGTLDRYVSDNGGYIDYIHDEDSVMRLASGDRCFGLLLPSMDKSELFGTVALKGVFPRKSFSVGNPRDKRYYLECRRIGN